jgi:hypothetical protein
LDQSPVSVLGLPVHRRAARKCCQHLETFPDPLAGPSTPAGGGPHLARSHPFVGIRKVPPYGSAPNARTGFANSARCTDPQVNRRRRSRLAQCASAVCALSDFGRSSVAKPISRSRKEPGGCRREYVCASPDPAPRPRAGRTAERRPEGSGSARSDAASRCPTPSAQALC